MAAAIGARGEEVIFRPERPAHRAAESRSREGAERCGSRGPAAAGARRKAKTQTCVPTSALHPRGMRELRK